MDCSNITLGIYTPLEALLPCAHNNCMGAHRYGQLCLLLINMLLGSFQLFLHDQPLSEGEIIPFSSVCQSRGGCITSRRRRWWLHALTDRLL